MAGPRMRWLGLAVGLMLLSGCSIQNRIALKDCQFNVRNVAVQSLTPLELRLVVTLGIYNPNRIEVIVDRFDYVVLINNKRVVDGESTQDLRIGQNQTGDLPITVRANVVDATRIIIDMQRTKRRVVTVRGTYYIKVPWGEYPFPVEVSHSF
ncbi:MAG: LEA14-like dessication related protein [Myxococcota bacterium]|jgi:LEA14-like dessication related protein